MNWRSHEIWFQCAQTHWVIIMMWWNEWFLNKFYVRAKQSNSYLLVSCCVWAISCAKMELSAVGTSTVKLFRLVDADDEDCCPPALVADVATSSSLLLYLRSFCHSIERWRRTWPFIERPRVRPIVPEWLFDILFRGFCVQHYLQTIYLQKLRWFGMMFNEWNILVQKWWFYPFFFLKVYNKKIERSFRFSSAFQNVISYINMKNIYNYPQFNSLRLYTLSIILLLFNVSLSMQNISHPLQTFL